MFRLGKCFDPWPHWRQMATRPLPHKSEFEVALTPRMMKRLATRVITPVLRDKSSSTWSAGCILGRPPSAGIQSYQDTDAIVPMLEAGLGCKLYPGHYRVLVSVSDCHHLLLLAVLGSSVRR